MNSKAKEQFEAIVPTSIKSQEFIRLTLGKYRGAESGLNKVVARIVQFKSGIKLSFVYRYKTREIVKNYSIEDGIALINQSVGTEFLSARLFTTQQDIQIEYSKDGNSKITFAKPTLESSSQTVAQPHDHQKKRLIEASANLYLTALGITNSNGHIVRTMEDKFRQINKFIEIVQSLIISSSLANQNHLSVVDMGSGKGYLTFAMYDFLTKGLAKQATIVGVEGRSELVELCNKIKQDIGFSGLRFEPGNIQDYTMEKTDITIALHACDTATDDAIFKGIKAQSSIIILSPCCHKQIRKQIRLDSVLKDILKHGILLERQAETITDGLRALLLEVSGYKTKVFEFISSEHTSKNMMIVGVKHEKTIDKAHILNQIKEIKALYGIRFHYLEALLFPSLSPNIENLIQYSERNKP
jgi:SAM-dependent methyltransferase